MADTSQKGQPKPSVQEIATTGGGRDITRPWVNGLQQPRDPRLLQSLDWGVYDVILSDDQVFSTLQQRKRAVVCYNWHISPGDEKDARSVEAADRFDEMMQKLGWDRVTEKMLHGIFTGFAVSEMLWTKSGKGLGQVQWDWGRIKVRHARRFRFDEELRLHLLTRNNTVTGELMPDRHFWTFAAGGNDDDEPYGVGLAHYLYWPCLFKRNGIRFWNLFIEKYAAPTAKGTYRRGTPKAEIDRLLEALDAMQQDSGIVVPEGTAIELIEAAKSGINDYAALCDYMDKAIAKIVLSQTMTTQDGSSLSQAQVHAGVKLEVVKADADLLSESFNDGPAKWWCELNYGPDVAPPRLTREVDEEADLKAQAETDRMLSEQGWERDEESFEEVYGAGYRRKPTPAPAALKPTEKPTADQSADIPENDNEEGNALDKASSFAAEDLRPLYVYRQLLNADELIDWARGQGFEQLLSASDMHVTITYSKKPVNWLKMGDYFGYPNDGGSHYVPAGGPRLVERIGDEGAIALFFYSSHLEQRNRAMREAGASWDYDHYFCHVSLTYSGEGPDLSAVEPYRGELRFGPEIFEPIKDDWEQSIRESSFTEPLSSRPTEDDWVEEHLIEQLMKRTPPIGQQMLNELSALGSEDELNDWLSDAYQRADVNGWGEDMAVAGIRAAVHGLLNEEADNGE